MHPAAELRRLLLTPGLLVLPGVYDALSAKVASEQGFSAICAGGFSATASLLGEPDLGQLSLRDYIDHYGRIVAASRVPVLVDADTGFGGVNQIRNAVQAFERAGAAGLFFEDQAFPKRCGYLAGKAVVPVEAMVTRIKAALDARTNPDFVVIARTDALTLTGVDDAISRAQAYAAAGADLTFVQGADDVETVTRVCRDIACPQLANVSAASGKTPLTLHEIETAGAAAVILPNTAMLAAAQAVTDVMRAMRTGQSLEQINQRTMSLGDYFKVVDLDAHAAWEASHS